MYLERREKREVLSTRFAGKIWRKQKALKFQIRFARKVARGQYVARDKALCCPRRHS